MSIPTMPQQPYHSGSASESASTARNSADTFISTLVIDPDTSASAQLVLGRADNARDLRDLLVRAAQLLAQSDISELGLIITTTRLTASRLKLELINFELILQKSIATRLTVSLLSEVLNWLEDLDSENKLVNKSETQISHTSKRSDDPNIGSVKRLIAHNEIKINWRLIDFIIEAAKSFKPSFSINPEKYLNTAKKFALQKSAAQRQSLSINSIEISDREIIQHEQTLPQRFMKNDFLHSLEDYEKNQVSLLKKNHDHMSRMRTSVQAVTAAIVNLYLRGQTTFTNVELQDLTTASFPTVAKTLQILARERIGEFNTAKALVIEDISINKFWHLLNKYEDSRRVWRLTSSLYRTARSVASMHRELLKSELLTTYDASMAGVSAAQHYYHEFDLTGAPCLCLGLNNARTLVEGQQQALAIAKTLDPEMEIIDDPFTPPTIMIALVNEPIKLRSDIYCSAFNAMADVVALRLETQASDIAQALLNEAKSRR